MKSIAIMLASFSVIMCLVIAYFLVFTELLMDKLHGTNRQIMIAVLLVYALFRSFRIFKLVKKS